MTVRWPFRREPTGRHALGAAVTAIPSGPPPAASVRLTSAAPEPAPQPRPVPVAQLPAVPVQALPVQQLGDPTPREVLPASPVVPQIPVQSVAEEPGIAVAQVVPAQPLPPAVRRPDVPQQSGPVGSGLEQLLVDELLALAAPVQAAPPAVPARPAATAAASAPAPAPAPAPVAPPAAAAPALPTGPARQGPRVELGFADGTYRMLDPASETAHALAELVGELTTAVDSGHDTPTGSSAER